MSQKNATNVVELQPHRVHRCACRLIELEIRLVDSPTREFRADLARRRVAYLVELEREALVRPNRDALRSAIIDVLDAYDRLFERGTDLDIRRALAAYETALRDLARAPYPHTE